MDIPGLLALVPGSAQCLSPCEDLSRLGKALLCCWFTRQANGASLISYQPFWAVAKEIKVFAPAGYSLPQVVVDWLPNRWDKGGANCISPQVTGKAGGNLSHGFPWFITAWKSQILCPRWAQAKSLVLTISSPVVCSKFIIFLKELKHPDIKTLLWFHKKACRHFQRNRNNNLYVPFLKVFKGGIKCMIHWYIGSQYETAK